MNDDINKVAANIVDATTGEVIEEIDKSVSQVVENPVLLEKINQTIEDLLIKYTIYERELESLKSSNAENYQYSKLELQKDLIYKDFFSLQNSMNAYFNQRIWITYVHRDPVTGEREIKILDNTVDNLKLYKAYGGTLQYRPSLRKFNNHYKKLINSLSEKENDKIQKVAKKVSDRQIKYRGIILWKIQNKWKGYYSQTLGPINEAFVNFYVNNYNGFSSRATNKDIDTYMLHKELGVITADWQNGFFIGDVSIGGTQLAVKGIGGGPQNFATVINLLKKHQSQFKHEDILKFKKDIMNASNARPLVKELSKKQVKEMIKYYTKEIPKGKDRIPEDILYNLKLRNRKT